MEMFEQRKEMPQLTAKRTGENAFIKWVGKISLHSVLIVIAIIQLFSIYWLALFSLKNNYEIFNLLPLAFPEELRFENYAKVWIEGNIATYFFNSVLYTVVSVLLTILLASMVTERASIKFFSVLHCQ